MGDESPHKAVAEVHLLQDDAHRDSITELNATQSPLLRLPAEIRNAIYTHVFSDQVYKYNEESDLEFSIICVAEYPPLGLLLASRQVYHETALLPYKLATFVFEVTEQWFPVDAQTFSERRSEEQLAALGRMEVMFCDQEWNGTGLEFSEELDHIRSGNSLHH